MELWQRRIKLAGISDRVHIALDYLTGGMENPARVWIMLGISEITGCGLQTCCCPVARFIQACVHDGTVHVFYDIVRVDYAGNSSVVIPLPYAIREFVRQFDEGWYTDLVDYDHRHGLLPIKQTS